MKRAFLVIGSERSGTRFLTRLLIKAGCDGEDTHNQKWDTEEITGDLIVWRRSNPHFGEWVNLEEMLNKLVRYKIHVLVPIRDLKSMALSKVKEGYADDEEDALRQIHFAYKDIFHQLTGFGIDYTIVTYESFILYGQKYIDWLLKIIGLESVEMEVIDGNLKYYN